MIDNFSRFGWTIPLKNKSAITINDSSENTLISYKRKPILINTDDVRGFAKKFSTDFLITVNNKRFYRNTSLGAVFAKSFDCTIRDLLRKPDFANGDSNRIDVLPTITKQYNNSMQFSAKITPNQASLKKKEGYVYKNLFRQTKEI